MPGQIIDNIADGIVLTAYGLRSAQRSTQRVITAVAVTGNAGTRRCQAAFAVSANRIVSISDRGRTIIVGSGPHAIQRVIVVGDRDVSLVIRQQTRICFLEQVSIVVILITDRAALGIRRRS